MDTEQYMYMCVDVIYTSITQNVDLFHIRGRLSKASSSKSSMVGSANPGEIGVQMGAPKN